MNTFTPMVSTLLDLAFELDRSALDSIQAAQLLIDEARRQLCSVVGFGDQWSNLADVHDSVKAGWYDVERRFTQLRKADSLQPET